MFQNSLYSALPFIGLWAMMNICPLIADKLRSTGIMSTVVVRKLFNSIGILLFQHFTKTETTILEYLWRESALVCYIHLDSSDRMVNVKLQILCKLHSFC